MSQHLMSKLKSLSGRSSERSESMADSVDTDPVPEDTPPGTKKVHFARGTKKHDGVSSQYHAYLRFVCDCFKNDASFVKHQGRRAVLSADSTRRVVDDSESQTIDNTRKERIKSSQSVDKEEESILEGGEDNEQEEEEEEAPLVALSPQEAWEFVDPQDQIWTLQLLQDLCARYELAMRRRDHHICPVLKRGGSSYGVSKKGHTSTIRRIREFVANERAAMKEEFEKKIASRKICKQISKYHMRVAEIRNEKHYKYIIKQNKLVKIPISP